METDATDLEFNARRIKKGFLEELTFVSKEGRFRTGGHGKGNRLQAVISAMAEGLLGSTQEVESINSIVRLLSVRCPRIDLQSLSSRITIKKAVTMTPGIPHAGKWVLSKTWSKLREAALPLLHELIGHVPEYKSVHNNTKRFEGIVGAAEWCDLSDCLRNNDLSKALPELRLSSRFKWVAASAARLRAALNNVERSSFLPSSCSSVLVLQETAEESLENPELGPQLSFYEVAVSLRAQTILVKLEVDTSGRLLETEHPEFTTVAAVFETYFEACQRGKATVKMCNLQCVRGLNGRMPQEFAVLSFKDNLHGVGELLDAGMSVVNHALKALERPMETLRHIQAPKQAKKPVADLAGDEQAAVADEDEADESELQDFLDLNSGFGFHDEVQKSVEEAAALNQELSAPEIDKSNARQLLKMEKKFKAASCASSASASDSRQAPAFNVDANKAVDHFHEVAGSSASRSDSSRPVGLTQEDLEEEAFLLLAHEVEAPAPNATKGQSNEAARTEKILRPFLRQSRAAKDLVEDLDVLAFSSASDSDPSDPEGNDEALQPPGKRLKTQQEKAEKALPAGRDNVKAVKAALVWVQKTMDTLKCIGSARERSRLPVGTNDEISLVARLPVHVRANDADQEDTHFHQIIFVRWTNAAEHEGRTIRVDAQHKVVYAPSFLFGKPVPTDFFIPPRFEVLVNCLGARSKKEKGALRDSIPDDMIRYVAFVRLAATMANQEGGCLGGWVVL